MDLEQIDEKLYFFAQRHYWLSPVVDRIRWRVEWLIALWRKGGAAAS